MYEAIRAHREQRQRELELGMHLPIVPTEENLREMAQQYVGVTREEARRMQDQIYVQASIISSLEKRAFLTDRKATVKITLARELVYELKLWVGKLGGMQAILGTDFMAPAGVRLDLAEGAACMPDEIRLRFEGRRPVYSDKVEQERLTSDTFLMPGQSIVVKCRASGRLGKTLWVARGDNWVTTAVLGDNNLPTACKVTNVSRYPTAVPTQTIVGLWLAPLAAPQRPRFVSLGSKRYAEWKTLVYEAEPEPELEARRQAAAEAYLASQPPVVSRPAYPQPKAILKREKPCASRPGGEGSPQQPMERELDAPEANSEAKVAILQAASVAEVALDQRELAEPVYIHEGSDLSAEDVERQVAMIPETPPEEEPTIDDVQVGQGEGYLTPEQVNRVKNIVWKRRHLCMGKGNAKPAAAKDVWCDIDVGDARPPPASPHSAQDATSTVGAAPAAPAASTATTRPLDSTAIAAARAAAYLPAPGADSARAHTPNASERQQDFGGITDMELYPIAYRDISALVDVGGLSPDAIHDWFVRYRKSKGKTMDVPPLALRASWNAFVRLWNEGRIREKVERWEASQRKYSLSTLREESFLIPDVERKADEVGDQQIEMETELDATTRSGNPRGWFQLLIKGVWFWD
ncbi:hypothetical protein ATCC90586_009883 [Pythium insidiosum]|nr:hypothetical protein ATCC90586_009883 [Pythium insidiosum]